MVLGCYGVFLILCQVILVFLGQPGRCRWIASRTDRDAKNARNEKRNEMNAKSEFAPRRSERWRHPEPRQPAWPAGSSSRAREGTKHPENWRLQGRHETPILQLRSRLGILWIHQVTSKAGLIQGSSKGLFCYLNKRTSWILAEFLAKSQFLFYHQICVSVRFWDILWNVSVVCLM